MFPKRKRVTKKLFDQIIKTGASISGSFFVFRYIKNTELPRYAFVSPKSVAKKAVNRNKLRRQGYNILRLFPIQNSFGIFFYKKNGSKASTQEIKKDIDFLLKKSKILN